MSLCQYRTTSVPLCGQDCEFSVETGQEEQEEDRQLETVEMVPLHHPSSQEITYIQADQSPPEF